MGFVNSSSCSGGSCSSTIIPIPIGLVFGAHHFFKATRYNDSLFQELHTLEFRDTVLAPKESHSGMLYFRNFSSENYSLQFRTYLQDSIPKLIIPLNQRFSQYLIRDFKTIIPQ